MANRPKLTIELETLLGNSDKTIDGYIKHLEEVQKEADRLDIGGAISETLQSALDEFKDLKKEYRDAVEDFAKQKIDTDQFDNFTKEIESKLDEIEQRVGDAEESLQNLQSTIDDLNLDKLKDQIKSTRKSFNGFKKDVKVAVDALKDFQKLMNSDFGNKKLAELGDSAEKLSNIDLFDFKNLKKGTASIEGLQTRLAVAYEDFLKLQKVMKDENSSPSMVEDAEKKIADLIPSIAELLKRIATLKKVDPGKIFELDYDFNNNNIKYNFNTIIHAIDNGITEVKERINTRRKDLKEEMDSMISTTTSTFSLGEDGITIPVVLDKEAMHNIEDDLKQFISKVSESTKNNPIDITVRFFPLKTTKQEAMEVEKHIKDIRAQIPKLEDKELSENLNGLVDNLEKEYQKALILKIKVEFSEDIEEIKRRITLIENAAKQADVKINPTFVITEEEANKLNEKLEKISKGFVTDFDQRITRMSDSLNRLFSEKKITDWGNAFEQVLQKIDSQLQNMKGLLEPLINLYKTTEHVKEGAGRPSKEFLESKSSIDKFTETMDLLNKALAEREKTPKLNAEDFTRDIQKEIDAANIPVQVPVEPNVEGFIEQLESKLKTIPVDIAINGITGGTVGGSGGGNIIIAPQNGTIEVEQATVTTEQASTPSASETKGGKAPSTKVSGYKGVSKQWIDKEFQNVYFGKRGKVTIPTEEQKAIAEFNGIYDAYMGFLRDISDKNNEISKLEKSRDKALRNISEGKGTDDDKALVKSFDKQYKKFNDELKDLNQLSKKHLELNPILSDIKGRSVSVGQKDKMLEKYLEGRGIKKTAPISAWTYLDKLKEEVSGKGDFNRRTGQDRAAFKDIVRKYIGFEYKEQQAKKENPNYKGRGWQIENLTDNVKAQKKLREEYNKMSGVINETSKAKENSISVSDKVTRKSDYEGISTEKLKERYAELAEEKEKWEKSDFSSADLITSNSEDVNELKSISETLNKIIDARKEANKLTKLGLVEAPDESEENLKKLGYKINEYGYAVDAKSKNEFANNLIQKLMASYNLDENFFKGIKKKQIDELSKQALTSGRKNDVLGSLEVELSKISTELRLREEEAKAAVQATEKIQEVSEQAIEVAEEAEEVVEEVKQNIEQQKKNLEETKKEVKQEEKKKESKKKSTKKKKEDEEKIKPDFLKEARDKKNKKKQNIEQQTQNTKDFVALKQFIASTDLRKNTNAGKQNLQEFAKRFTEYKKNKGKFNVVDLTDDAKLQDKLKQAVADYTASLKENKKAKEETAATPSVDSKDIENTDKATEAVKKNTQEQKENKDLRSQVFEIIKQQKEKKEIDYGDLDNHQINQLFNNAITSAKSENLDINQTVEKFKQNLEYAKELLKVNTEIKKQQISDDTDVSSLASKGNDLAIDKESKARQKNADAAKEEADAVKKSNEEKEKDKIRQVLDALRKSDEKGFKNDLINDAAGLNINKLINAKPAETEEEAKELSSIFVGIVRRLKKKIQKELNDNSEFKSANALQSSLSEVFQDIDNLIDDKTVETGKKAAKYGQIIIEKLAENGFDLSNYIGKRGQKIDKSKLESFPDRIDSLFGSKAIETTQVQSQLPVKIEETNQKLKEENKVLDENTQKQKENKKAKQENANTPSVDEADSEKIKKNTKDIKENIDAQKKAKKNKYNVFVDQGGADEFDHAGGELYGSYPTKKEAEKVAKKLGNAYVEKSSAEESVSHQKSYDDIISEIDQHKNKLFELYAEQFNELYIEAEAAITSDDGSEEAKQRILNVYKKILDTATNTDFAKPIIDSISKLSFSGGTDEERKFIDFKKKEAPVSFNQHVNGINGDKGIKVYRDEYNDVINDGVDKIDNLILQILKDNIESILRTLSHNDIDVPKDVIKRIHDYNISEGRKIEEEAAAVKKSNEAKKEESIKLYHGTNKTFDKFDVSKSTHKAYGAGGYFTENPELAQKYGKNVTEWYATVTNMFEEGAKLSEEEIKIIFENYYETIQKIASSPKLRDFSKFDVSTLSGFQKAMNETINPTQWVLDQIAKNHNGGTSTDIFKLLGYDSYKFKDIINVFDNENIRNASKQDASNIDAQTEALEREEKQAQKTGESIREANERIAESLANFYNTGKPRALQDILDDINTIDEHLEIASKKWDEARDAQLNYLYGDKSAKLKRTTKTADWWIAREKETKSALKDELKARLEISKQENPNEYNSYIQAQKIKERNNNILEAINPKNLFKGTISFSDLRDETELAREYTDALKALGYEIKEITDFRGVESRIQISPIDDKAISDAKEAEKILANIGLTTGEAYAEGIESSKSEAQQAGADLANAANEGTADAQKSKSPSKVAEKLGKYWGEGYADGILNSQAKVKNAVRALVETAKLTLDDLRKDNIKGTDTANISKIVLDEIYSGKNPTKMSQGFIGHIQDVDKTSKQKATAKGQLNKIINKLNKSDTLPSGFIDDTDFNFEVWIEKAEELGMEIEEFRKRYREARSKFIFDEELEKEKTPKAKKEPKYTVNEEKEPNITDPKEKKKVTSGLLKDQKAYYTELLGYEKKLAEAQLKQDDELVEHYRKQREEAQTLYDDTTKRLSALTDEKTLQQQELELGKLRRKNEAEIADIIAKRVNAEKKKNEEDAQKQYLKEAEERNKQREAIDKEVAKHVAEVEKNNLVLNADTVNKYTGVEKPEGYYDYKQLTEDGKWLGALQGPAEELLSTYNQLYEAEKKLDQAAKDFDKNPVPAYAKAFKDAKNEISAIHSKMKNLAQEVSIDALSSKQYEQWEKTDKALDELYLKREAREEVFAQKQAENAQKQADAVEKASQKELEALIAKYDRMDVEEQKRQAKEQEKRSKKYGGLQGKLESAIYDLGFEKENGNPTAEFAQQLENKIIDIKTLIEKVNNEGIDVVTEDEIMQAEKLLEEVRQIRKEGKLTENRKANENSIQKNLAQINSMLSDNTKLSFKRTDVYKDLVSLQERFKNFDTSRPQSELAELTTELLKTKARFEDLDNTVKGKNLFQTFIERIHGTTAQLVAQYLSWMDIIRYIRTMATTIIDLDTQLVDLRKTTTMTTSELNEFYNASSDIAKTLGVTTSEIISQSAAWSRLGYSSKEAATEMAQLSSKFASISPGMTTDNSTDYLVSTMQAYGIAVDDVERKILDNVNRIGNILPKHTVTYGAKYIA